MIKEWIKIPTKYCTEIISLLMFRLGETARSVAGPNSFQSYFYRRDDSLVLECDFLISIANYTRTALMANVSIRNRYLVKDK